MPATTLEAHATVDGILEFRDPRNDDAWLATSEPAEVRP